MGDEGKWVIVIPGRAVRGGSAPGEPLEDRELSNCRSTGGCWSAGEREGEEQQEKEGGRFVPVVQDPKRIDWI